MVKNYEEAFNKIKVGLEKARNNKIRTEARLEQLNIQKKELLSEIEKLGISPENMEQEIERLKHDIEDFLKRADRKSVV